MSRLTDKVRDQVASMNDGHLRPAESGRLLTLSRTAMEEANTAENYPHLSLYSNWYLHTKIDRKGGEVVLEKLDRALNGIVENKVEYEPSVSMLMSVLSVYEFVDEQIKFLMANDIYPGFLLDRSKSSIFINHIMSDLCSRPIERPRKTQDKIREGYENQNWNFLSIGILIDYPAERVGNENYTITHSLKQCSDLDGGTIEIKVPIVTSW